MGVDFDGTDDHLVAGGVVDIATTGGSLCFWAKLDNISNDAYFLTQLDAGNTALGSWILWQVGSQASPGCCQWSVRNANTQMSVRVNDVFSVGTWKHVALTYAGGTAVSGVKIYVNGTEGAYSIQTAGSGGINSGGGAVVLGSSKISSTRQLNGVMAEVAVYNTVLDAASVATLANSGNIRNVAGLPLTVSRSNLVSYWAINDYPDGSSADARTYANTADSRYPCTGSWGSAGLISSVENGFLSPSGGMW